MDGDFRTEFVREPGALRHHPALVLNADYRPLSYFPLSLYPWQEAIKAAVMDRVTAPERPAPFAVMHVDLDYFKAVNDSFGHAAGDHVLHQVAHILRQETRSGDFVARLGGDEFVVVLRECGDRVLVERIAGRILERLEAPLSFDGQDCRISASIGSTLSSHYRRLQSSRLLGDADRALYRSKHQGRGRHTIFQPET